MAYEECPNCKNKKHVLLACSFCGYRHLNESGARKSPITTRTKSSVASEAPYALAQPETSQPNKKRQKISLRKQGQPVATIIPKKGRIISINAQQIEQLEKARKVRVAKYAKKKGISIAQASQELKAPLKTKRKSEPEYRKTPNKHLTSSLYLSISASIWPYHS